MKLNSPRIGLALTCLRFFSDHQVLPLFLYNIASFLLHPFSRHCANIHLTILTTTRIYELFTQRRSSRIIIHLNLSFASSTTHIPHNHRRVKRATDIISLCLANSMTRPSSPMPAPISSGAWSTKAQFSHSTLRRLRQISSLCKRSRLQTIRVANFAICSECTRCQRWFKHCMFSNSERKKDSPVSHPLPQFPVSCFSLLYGLEG